MRSTWMACLLRARFECLPSCATNLRITLTLYALCGIGWLPASCAQADPAPVEPPSVSVDHHVHALSPELLRDWSGLEGPFSKPDDVYTELATLDRQRAAALGAVLVPMGHLYAMVEFQRALGLGDSAAQQAVERENQYVKELAARSSNRVALCSVPIRAGWAERALKRCLEDPGYAGIKLHLGAARADFRDAETVELLSAVFSSANAAGLPILLHLDNQVRGTDIEHIEFFLRRVLGPLPDAQVLIAHLGGSGGYAVWTQRVYHAINRWLAKEAKAGRPRAGIHFDISAVALTKSVSGLPAISEEEARQLAKDMRTFGLSRLVFASDWPSFAPDDYLKAFSRFGQLQAEDIAVLMGQRFEFVRRHRHTAPDRPGK